MPKEKMYNTVINKYVEMKNLASDVEIDDILRPGLLEEMVVANCLGHKLICSTYDDSDACSMDDSNEKYEYVPFKEGYTGQLCHMFKEPVDKRANSLKRITRNTKIYFPMFYGDDRTKCKTIYEVEPNAVLVEAEHQLDQSSNSISHVGFSETWVEKNGNVVYQNG